MSVCADVALVAVVIASFIVANDDIATFAPSDAIIVLVGDAFVATADAAIVAASIVCVCVRVCAEAPCNQLASEAR